MNDTINQLETLGFGNYEARAYVALLQRSPLNGYELAQASGIPRANIYTVLQKLEERGAVTRLDTTDSRGVRFAPVPPSELTRRLSRRFNQALQSTRQALSQVAAPTQYEYVWNTRGYENMLQSAQSLLDSAKKRVLLALWRREAKALAFSFAEAEKRGVALTTLCLNGCAEPCGYCLGKLYRYPVVPEQRTRWLVLVPDSAELLAAEIGAGEHTLTVRTRTRMLIDLARWYIRHSIALAALVNDLGERLDHLISPQTRAILDDVGPDSQVEGWLGHMRGLLARQNAPTSTQERKRAVSEKGRGRKRIKN